MLSRDKFNKSLQGLLFFKGIEPNEMANNAYFNLLKNDFEDDEFEKICFDICKTEEMFNKYPDPKMFYDRKEGGDKDVYVCIDSGYIDISDEANKALELMTDNQYQRMISWMRSHIDGKTMKKSSLSNIVLGFCGNTNQELPKEEYVGLTEIKQMLENHYKEENDE